MGGHLQTEPSFEMLGFPITSVMIILSVCDAVTLDTIIFTLSRSKLLEMRHTNKICLSSNK